MNICDKDGLTNLWISLEKLMDQTSDWPERQKEDRASSAAVSSVVERERLTREGGKELIDKREREVIVKLR